MVNTNMTHVFRHPKFYRIPRDKSDQVISESTHDGESERAPGPGHKPQAPRQAFEPTCSSAKRQASQPE
jgi:hypothetical protein